MATFEENIKNTLQKTLKAGQARDVTFYTPYNPRRIWPLLTKTLYITKTIENCILQKPLKIVYCKLAARTPGVILASPTPLSTICA